MESDPDLLARYRTNAEALGRRFDLDDAGAPGPPSRPTWPTCRWPCPTIHPLLAIESARGGQPPARVRRRLRHRVRRHRRAGRRAGHGLDGDRRRRAGPLRDRLLAGPAGRDPPTPDRARPAVGPGTRAPMLPASVPPDSRSAPSGCCSARGARRPRHFHRLRGDPEVVRYLYDDPLDRDEAASKLATLRSAITEPGSG